ncbi:MAG: c-type cytochrome [Bryobacteraceae bacterium]
MRTFTVWVMLGSAGLLAQHVQDEDKKKRNPAIGNIAAIAAGEKAFNEGCAVCHGQGGQGGRGPNLSHGGVMWHTLTDEATFKRIKEGVPSGGMPPTPGSDEKIWQLAAYVLALRAPASEAPQTGDAELGKTLFWGKAGCNQCHSILGKGGNIGPDLSDAGGSRSTAVIRSAIEDPGANGSKGFEKAHIVLKNGKTLDGVLKNRNNYSLQLLDAGGDLHLLLMNSVKELTVAKNSAMPSNYKSRLSAAEIDALVAYLAKQTARPSQVAAN